MREEITSTLRLPSNVRLLTDAVNSSKDDENFQSKNADFSAYDDWRHYNRFLFGSDKETKDLSSWNIYLMRVVDELHREIVLCFYQVPSSSILPEYLEGQIMTVLSPTSLEWSSLQIGMISTFSRRHRKLVTTWDIVISVLTLYQLLWWA